MVHRTKDPRRSSEQDARRWIVLIACTALSLATSLLTACTKKGGGTSVGEISPSVSTVVSPGSGGISTPGVSTPATNPYYSNASSVTVSGSCTTGYTVTLSGADSQTQTCASSAYSFSVSKTSDATYNFNVIQTSTTLVDSSAAAPVWIRDTVAPPTPTVTSPATNPYTSSDGSIVVSGTCETAATVTMAGASSGTTTCAASAFSFTITQASNGTHNFTFTQTDRAGNASSGSAFQWIKTGGVPSTPVITSPATSPYYSNGSSLVISGTCTSGNTVTLSGADSQNMTCTGGNTFSFTVNKSTDSTYGFNVIQTNGGQDSGAASQTWVRDTLAPSPPTITSPTSNPYTSADTTFSLSGACENNATVTLAGDSSGTTTCASSTYSFSITKSSDATYNFTLSQTDRASNASGTTAFQWIRNTSLPPTPTILSPAANPHYSNGNSVTVSGGCVTGNTVTLGGADSQTFTCASSAYSFTVTKGSDNSYLLTVKQTSGAGDSAQASVTWVRDTVAPSAPTVTTPTVNPYTSSNSNFTLAGGCEDNATVNLTGDDTQSVVCASSTYSFTISKSVDATYNFTLRQTDRAANQSGTTTQQWIRGAVPANPTITNPAVSPFYSNLSSVTVSGGCINAATVTLGGNVVAGDVTSPAGSLTQTCALSSYSFTIGKSSDSSYTFTVKQNTGGPDSGTVSLVWIRDTAAPDTTITANPPATNIQTTATFNFTSTESGSTFQCKLDAGSYASCSSPITLSSLSNGSHTYSIRATDRAGNTDASPASYTWTQETYNALALYHFDTSPGALIDSGLYTSTNHNDLTASTTTAGASAQFAQSRLFTAASSQSMSRADTGSLDANRTKMTVDLWVNFTTSPGNGAYYVLVTKSGGAGQLSWELRLDRLNSTRRIVFVGSTDGSASTTVNSTAVNWTTGAWHHIAVTWDLGTVNFFWDGAAQGSGSIGVVGSATLFDGNGSLRLGTDNAGVNYLDGTMDELRISQIVRWSGAFTPSASAYTAD